MGYKSEIKLKKIKLFLQEEYQKFRWDIDIPRPPRKKKEEKSASFLKDGKPCQVVKPLAKK